MGGFSYTEGMSKDFSPTRLDVRAFAKTGGHLEGELPLSQLKRLVKDAELTDMVAPPVRWEVSGELQTSAGGTDEVWLHMQAETQMPMVCQRCLTLASIDVHVDRSFRFVADEATAELEDDDAEEDVLALSKDFDLTELMEDELLMEVPLVPRHDVCPVPVKMQVGDAAVEQAVAEKQNPFAMLQGLKVDKSN